MVPTQWFTPRFLQKVVFPLLLFIGWWEWRSPPTKFDSPFCCAQAHQMMQHSGRIVHLGGGIMLLMGTYYLINGMKWVVLVWQQS